MDAPVKPGHDKLGEFVAPKVTLAACRKGVTLHTKCWPPVRKISVPVT
jgi:hypothetical protein